jgi:hypothetical protein
MDETTDAPEVSVETVVEEDDASSSPVLTPISKIETNQIRKTMPICFASIDIGQSYFATTIVTRCDFLESAAPTENATKPFIELDGKQLPKYRIVHMGIDEFAVGSAPHQPISTLQNAFQTKMMEQYESQRADQEYQQILKDRGLTEATVTRQARRAAMGLQKKRASKKAKSSSESTSGTSQPNAQNMPEMSAVRGAAECIRTYYHRHGIQFVFVEDQLPTVRRNRTIQAAIVAACHTLEIPVMAVGPSMKFLFASKSLQSEYRKIEKERGSTLKTISTRLFERLFDAEAPTLTHEPDLVLLDLESFHRENEKRDWYDHINNWYRKDLSDAFWQLVTALKINFDDLSKKYKSQ